MQTVYEIFSVTQDQIKCIHYTASFSHFILSRHKLLYNNMSPTGLSHKKKTLIMIKCTIIYKVDFVSVEYVH